MRRSENHCRLYLYNKKESLCIYDDDVCINASSRVGIPSIRKFLPNIKTSYSHPDSDHIWRFIRQHHGNSQQVRCVILGEDNVKQNWLKEVERQLPKELLNLVKISPLIGSEFKTSFSENMSELDKYIETVEVSHFRVSNSDEQLFQQKGKGMAKKDVVPDDEDFRILLYAQATKRPTYIISRDQHFTKNTELIKKNYGATVIPQDSLKHY